MPRLKNMPASESEVSILSKDAERRELRGKVLLVLLGGLAVSLFFSQSGIAIFGIPAIVLMAAEISRPLSFKAIPKALLISGGLVIADLFIAALYSENRRAGLAQFKEQWYVLFVLLPFLAAADPARSRKVIAVFLFAGAAAGIFGILQTLTSLFGYAERAHGLTHPIHFAHNLAFASVAAVLLLALRFRLGYSKAVYYFLIVVALATAGGLLLTKSRGVIVAFIPACVIPLLLLNWKRAVVFVLIAGGLCIPLLMADSSLRERFKSIVTSWQTEDERGSSGNRIELWKGSLMIFESSPLLGTGTGDFEADIKELIRQGKLRPAPVTMHAHNIYLQALATRGLPGLLLFAALLAALLNWGYRMLKQGQASGYLMLGVTVLMIFGGLSENNFGVSKVFAAYCFTIGLFGSFREVRPDAA